MRSERGFQRNGDFERFIVVFVYGRKRVLTFIPVRLCAISATLSAVVRCVSFCHKPVSKRLDCWMLQSGFIAWRISSTYGYFSGTLSIFTVSIGLQNFVTALPSSQRVVNLSSAVMVRQGWSHNVINWRPSSFKLSCEGGETASAFSSPPC